MASKRRLSSDRHTWPSMGRGPVSITSHISASEEAFNGCGYGSAPLVALLDTSDGIAEFSTICSRMCLGMTKTSIIKERGDEKRRCKEVGGGR